MFSKIWLLVCCCLLFSLSAQAQSDPAKLVEAARAQIGVTVAYDPAYRVLDFPGGDVPVHTGVCTDVVIRALRRQNVDLQLLVHQDMKKAWPAYPKIWGLSRPDSNIDHRRVPNLETFFRRNGTSLPLNGQAQFLPGDIVSWRLPQGKLPHIGIVSDKRAEDGTPLIIHNIGQGVREENVLFAFPLKGHFRY